MSDNYCDRLENLHDHVMDLLRQRRHMERVFAELLETWEEATLSLIYERSCDFDEDTKNLAAKKAEWVVRFNQGASDE